MFNFVKHGALKRPLELRKTYDFCASGKPILTVVMLHGIASDSKTFLKILNFFSSAKTMRDVRFVTFDLLGAGKSYRSNKLSYNYAEQLSALENSIKRLHITTPLVLLGHSMGTLISTRYASLHQNEVSELILVSPPIYTPENLKDPAFKVAIAAFEQTMDVKNFAPSLKKAFYDSMREIVLNPENYEVLQKIKLPTTLIYGDEDKIIAAENIPGILKKNKLISAIKTRGRHGVTRDKYAQILKALEGAIDANNIEGDEDAEDL